MRRHVATGLDSLLADSARLATLRGLRVALLGHPASVTREFEHAVDALLRAGVHLVRLFGPEHGLRGDAQYMVAVDDAADPWTGVPTTSLYGTTVESLRPTGAQLRGVDLLLVDLQDVGARYYTYVYTALLCVERCTELGIPVLVLDRPNPIGGVAVEGDAVSDGFSSFVGMLPLPPRHGLTLAEVLRFARDLGRRLEFEIVSCAGWTRELFPDQHDAPWVLPSPNMPTPDTALVYPGMCLLEGTEVSEGRGTTRPFELFGAPWIDPYRWADEIRGVAGAGFRLREGAITPTHNKWAGVRCGALQVHVVDRDVFQPVRFGFAVVWSAARLGGRSFAWNEQAYEFVEDISAIDLLFGSSGPRIKIEKGCSFEDLEDHLATSDSMRRAIEAARLPAYDPAAAASPAGSFSQEGRAP